MDAQALSAMIEEGGGSITQISSLMQLKFIQSENPQSVFSIVNAKSLPEELFAILDQAGVIPNYFWSLFHESGSYCAVFTPAGILLWNCVTSTLQKFEIGFVPCGQACFIDNADCVSLLALLGTGEFRFFPNVDTLACGAFGYPNTRCFTELEEGKLVLATNDCKTVIMELGTGSVVAEKSDRVAKLNPFRRSGIDLCDAVKMENVNGYIIAASHANFSVFSTSCECLATVGIMEGTPLAVGVSGNSGFVATENEGTVYITRILGVFTDNMVVDDMKEIDMTSFKGLACVGSDMCCVADSVNLYGVIFDGVTRPYALKISENPGDVVLSVSLNPDDTITVVSAKNGVHVLNIVDIQRMKLRTDEQTRLMSQGLAEWLSTGTSTFAARLGAPDCVFEQYDSYLTGINQVSVDILPAVLERKMNLHTAFVRLANTVSPIASPVFELNGYKLAILMTIVMHSDEARSMFEVQLEDGNVEEIMSIMKSELEQGNYRMLGLLIAISEATSTHFTECCGIYRTDVGGIGIHAELLELALSSCTFEFDEVYGINEYTTMCILAFRIIQDQDICVGFVEKLLDVSIDHAEEIALFSGAYSVLAEVIHRTQDFDKSIYYLERCGENIIEPLLKAMLDQCYVADIIRIGCYPQWHAAAGEILSYHSLAEAVHYITNNDQDLVRAARLLIAVCEAAGEIYSMQQIGTFYSMAKMCCLGAGYDGEELAKANNKLMLLELQSSNGLGNEDVMPAAELANHFVASNNILTALCIYKCSIHERDDEGNSRLLAHILGAAAATTEPIPLHTMLVESGAACIIPETLALALQESIANEAKRQEVMQVVQEAYVAIQSL